MPWADLIPLIAQVGIPMAEAIWKKAQSGADATQADWDELRSLGKLTPRDQLVKALTDMGVALESPQALALLETLPK